MILDCIQMQVALILLTSATYCPVTAPA